MRRVEKYHFILRADEPIAHHAETRGNTKVLQQAEQIAADGSLVRVPIVTGDTMRHGLREAGTWEYLAQLGIGRDSLSESAIRLLFNGGVMRSAGSIADIEATRELHRMVPHVGLMGAALESSIERSSVDVSAGILICAETIGDMPEDVRVWVQNQGRNNPPAADHIDEVSRYRHDALVDHNVRALLTASARANLEGRLLAHEAAGRDNDRIAQKEQRVIQMMPRSYQVVKKGALFFWQVTATTWTDLARDAFKVMMGSFLYACRVGGERAKGNGLLTVVMANTVDISSMIGAARRMEYDALAPAEFEHGAIYKAHIQDNREDIMSFLARVKA